MQRTKTRFNLYQGGFRFGLQASLLISVMKLIQVSLKLLLDDLPEVSVSLIATLAIWTPALLIAIIGLYGFHLEMRPERLLIAAFPRSEEIRYEDIKALRLSKTTMHLRGGLYLNLETYSGRQIQLPLLVEAGFLGAIRPRLTFEIPTKLEMITGK
jgi:hypothetical protein